MTICIDTNAYSDLMRGNARAREIMESASGILVPSVAMGELYAGFRRGNRYADNVSRLERFMRQPGVRIGAIDASVARVYGSVVAELTERGTPIPTNDIWIAAIALHGQAQLVSRDTHFDMVPLIERISW